MMMHSLISVELVYSVLIIILCSVIYLKTKDMYGLTKHKGIGYFRKGFLFFALAYLFRFLFMMFKFSWMAFDVRTLNGMMWPINLLIMGYFGTLAISYLALSSIWKKINCPYINIFIHIISIVIALLALVSASTNILLYAHSIFIIFTLVMFQIAQNNNKRFSNTLVIYVLLFIFWLINILVLGPRTHIPFEIKLVSYLVSGLIFVLIYYKVTKWVR